MTPKWKEKAKAGEKEYTVERQQADQKRGILTNAVGVGILAVLSLALGLKKYAALALLLQWIVFACHGFPNNSEKFYDASGSATHLLLIVSSLLSQDTHHPRNIITAVMVIMWLVRLGSMLFLRILRDSVDTRFIKMKKDPVRFLGVWTLQAVWVFLVDLPVLIIHRDAPDLTSMQLQARDYLAIVLWVVGFLCEVLADSQKFVFRAKPENKGSFITTGLWRFSRHPNYFGEILMWCSICLSCSSAWSGLGYLGLLSPLFTTALLLKGTGVPMLESAGLKKWGKDPAYVHYMSHTSCIIPKAPAPPFGEKKAI